MNERMAIDAPIKVGLRLEPEHAHYRVASVAIQSARPVLAANVLVGKSVGDATTLLPLLFSVCGRAQASASLQAIEKSGRQQVAPHVARARQALVDLESLREHIVRLCLQWPKLFNATIENRQQLVEALAIIRALEAQINPQNGLFFLGETHTAIAQDATRELTESLYVHIGQLTYAEPVAHFAERCSVSDIADWIDEGNAGATYFLRELVNRDWQAVGNARVDPLPVFDEHNEAELITLMQYEQFIAAPDWRGKCCETSPITRNNNALLRHCKTEYGNGLFTRAIALLTEVVALITGLRDWSNGCGLLFGDRSDSTRQLGQVVAARGQLCHSVSVCNNQIKRYRILAPTEWNFHPEGIAQSALSQLRGTPEAIRLQAALFMELLDPCVGYQVEVLEHK